MAIEISRAQNRSDLEQILSLQKQNLPNALSQIEKEKEGFLTVTHTLDLLVRMNNVCPHIIAKDGNKLVGYALCMHPKFGDEIAILKPMINEINTILPQDESFIIMGQVCIHKAYRKAGIFRKLYKKMQETVGSINTNIVTEVDASNTRSLIAHLAVGFQELKIYNASGRKWHLIAMK
ncbi:GNAT family N-acetyltransferase [uncultured Eudoraea sp.]|uniref:GNAT family N-acetyltransferase n=1 Tax=uncultured Eudoraea sp. TaxID=1035614 RepID=UPI002605CDDD|nr:GNAT family N-acetyltransferase [uncultured Eudoraea sp.]